MGIKKYNKLVRDRIPGIIQDSGKFCKTEILSDEDFLKMIDAKLDEELEEYHQDQSIEELADLLEVLCTAATARGYSIAELEKVRAKKAAERGGFSKKILLKEVSDKPARKNEKIVKLSAVLDAIEMASDSCEYYYDLENNETVCYMNPDYYGAEAENDALGDMIAEGFRTRFIPLPGRYEIHEYRIMEEFIDDEVPAGGFQNQLYNAIRGRGAFRRFKDAIRRMGIEQEWYDYRSEYYKKLAIEWCEDHELDYE